MIKISLIPDIVIRYRGREPEVEPLLRRKGFLN
jgi:hypothetical protein